MMLPSFCFAYDVNGLWGADKDRTVEFNSKHTILTEDQMKYLQEHTDNMYLLFDGSKLCQVMLPKKLTIEGRGITTRKHSWEFQIRKEGLGKGLVLINKKNNDEITSDVVNFTNPNEFWIYSGFNVGGKLSHIREYYSKIESSSLMSDQITCK